MRLHSTAQCDCSLLLLGITTSGLEEPFVSWTFVGVQAENDCRCVSGIEQTHRRTSRTTRTGSRRRSMCCFVVRPSRRPSEKGLWGTWRNSYRCFYYLYVCLNLLLSIWGGGVYWQFIFLMEGGGVFEWFTVNKGFISTTALWVLLHFYFLLFYIWKLENGVWF